MKKNTIIFLLIIVSLVFILPYILSDKAISQVNFSITFLSGLSSIITVVIAVLLYSKYGIDKSIKDKNLEISLSLLEAIKNTSVLINGNDGWMLQYRPTTFSMKNYESSYSRKLVFPSDYWNQIAHLSIFSDNLYLPNQIKQKLDNLLPFSMGTSSNNLDLNDYGKVIIGKTISNEWKFDLYNGEPLTLFQYLLNWEELIITTQDWCSKNSDEKIDLNINDK